MVISALLLVRWCDNDSACSLVRWCDNDSALLLVRWCDTITQYGYLSIVIGKRWCDNDCMLIGKMVWKWLCMLIGTMVWQYQTVNVKYCMWGDPGPTIHLVVSGVPSHNRDNAQPVTITNAAHAPCCLYLQYATTLTAPNIQYHTLVIVIHL